MNLTIKTRMSMKVFHDELHDNYDILNLSFNDAVALSNVLNSTDLTNRRIFYKLKEDIDKLIAIKKQPKKKPKWQTSQ